MSSATITGWGTALPTRTLDNAELAARLEISEEWIFQRTGIRSRRIVSGAETTSTLAAAASSMALARSGIAPDDIDLVIVATATGDHHLPATASLVQAALGCSNAGAFDLNAGCAGFLYALAQGTAMIESGSFRRVVVCGADVLSRMTDYSDPKSCILFGDGAGAVVLERSDKGMGLGPFLLRSDGSAPELLWIPRDEALIRMNGREVFRHAVEAMTSALKEILDQAHLNVSDLDLVIVHQANGRIVEAVADRLGLGHESVVVNIESVGNTSAASIPLALAEAVEQGRLRPGATVALAAFGAGFAWGAGILHWDPVREVPKRLRGLPALVGTAGLLLEIA